MIFKYSNHEFVMKSHIYAALVLSFKLFLQEKSNPEIYAGES
jgi:hypothetical protein